MRRIYSNRSRLSYDYKSKCRYSGPNTSYNMKAGWHIGWLVFGNNAWRTISALVEGLKLNTNACILHPNPKKNSCKKCTVKVVKPVANPGYRIKRDQRSAITVHIRKHYAKCSSCLGGEIIVPCQGKDDGHRQRVSLTSLSSTNSAVMVASYIVQELRDFWAFSASSLVV